MARLDRIIERLDLKEFQLRALLDVTKAINNNTGREDLLKLFEHSLREELGITRLMLFESTERGWSRILAYGTDTGNPDIDVMALFGENNDIQVIGAEHAISLGSFDIAIPVHHQDRPLALLLIGDIDEEEQRMSPAVKHLNFIQTMTNLIVVAMENQRLAKQALKQALAKRELELAAEMQNMLVPRDLPNNDRIKAAGWYQPHSEVGGDYYDLITLNEDEVVVAVADVSGKGIAAALLMSNFQANLHASVRHGNDLTAVVMDLNEKVFTSARGERFITLFIGHINLRTRQINYVNAGHNAPLVCDPDGIRTLQDGSIALGMMPELPFLKVGKAEFPKPKTLLCYTDGLVEQEDNHGNAFETNVVERMMVELGANGPEFLNKALINAFETHRSTQPYLDDIALLTCRIY